MSHVLSLGENTCEIKSAASQLDVTLHQLYDASALSLLLQSGVKGSERTGLSELPLCLPVPSEGLDT